MLENLSGLSAKLSDPEAAAVTVYIYIYIYIYITLDSPLSSRRNQEK